MDKSAGIERDYEAASGRWAGIGVDAAAALRRLARIAVSVQCWQGDDVAGFEGASGPGGGLAVTGRHPGRARNADELRADMEFALGLIPGTHRVNLHAIYAETGGSRVERTELGPGHFAAWMDWADELGLGMDFNPTFFAHPRADDGFTLAHGDEAVRGFWIEHGRACRRIGAAMGRRLGSPCVTNVWVPDGHKDAPADRLGPRLRLRDSLDRVFADELDPAHNLDSVESKLFGIGAESYTVGSHEFYLGYAVARGKLLCLDTGHFHPTEVVSDKLSAVMLWLDRALLHVSRGVRWDSDHVPALDDELLALARELVRGGFLDRVHIGLDFFDAGINRVAAWVIGTRNLLKALLAALLEPRDTLRELEAAGDYTSRLALLEELKTMPLGAVWDYHCLADGKPPGLDWLPAVKDYEFRVLARR